MTKSCICDARLGINEMSAGTQANWKVAKYYKYRIDVLNWWWWQDSHKGGGRQDADIGLEELFFICLV